MVRKYNQGVADANRKRTKHGGAINARQGGGDPLYRLWRDLKNRCFNVNHQHYHRYGGRGITMFAEWAKDYATFARYVGPKPAGVTLDRIDNDRGYEPNNVRWATRKEQANNRSTNVFIERNGMTMTLAQWADHLGWEYGMIASRWKKGKRGDALFAEPEYERNKVVEFKGQFKTLRKWADDTGVPYETLVWRHKHNRDLL